MIQITRKLEFDYGHRVLGHEGKCKLVHGHRGLAEITVQAPELDIIGRVIDFGVIKQKVGGWIDANWDHNLLLNPLDPLTQHLHIFEGQKVFLLPDGNPTAENMAAYLFRVCRQELADSGLAIIRVRLWETPNCYADYIERKPIHEI